MKVIITGGTGLIGSHLAADLAKDGHEVVVLSRSPEKHRTDLPAGVRAVGWDARTARGWAAEADGADAIVNLAGESLDNWPWTEERKRSFWDSRVNAGQAVVQAVEQAQQKPAVVIQSSAVGYYGPHGDEILTEDARPGDDFLGELCVAWEASTQPVEAMGVRQAVIRTGIVLTMESGALPRLVLPFRLFAGGPLGSGQQYYPWIHLQDEVKAIRYLLEDPETQGPYNLTAPNPVTNRAFAQTLGSVMNRPSFLPAPAFALKLALGQMSTVVLDGQRAVPEKLQAANYTFRYPKLEAALRDLLQ